MSRSVNKVILVGNVGADPETRSTTAGTLVASVSLATNRKRKDRYGQVENIPAWHRVVFWDKLAEIVRDYVHKGDRLYIEGRIEYTQHTDGSGVTRYYTDIVCQELVMLGGRGSADPLPGADDDDNDIPF